MRQWGNLKPVALAAALAAAMACGGKQLSPSGQEGQDGSASDGGSGSGFTEDATGSSSSGNSGGTSGSDSGGFTGSGSDSGGVGSSGSSGCDMSVDGAAFTCGSGDAAAIPPPNFGTSCDQCIEGCCSTSWCACAGDSGVSDAGEPTGCLGYVACVQICLFPPADSGVDASTVSSCANKCAATYPQNQVTEGETLITCFASSCAAATQCGPWP